LDANGAECIGSVSGKVKFKWVYQFDDAQSRGGKGAGKEPFKGDAFEGLFPDAIGEILWNGSHNENGERIGPGSSFEGEVEVGSVPCLGGTMKGLLTINTQGRSFYLLSYEATVESCGDISNEKIDMWTARGNNNKLVETTAN